MSTNNFAATLNEGQGHSYEYNTDQYGWAHNHIKLWKKKSVNVQIEANFFHNIA